MLGSGTFLSVIPRVSWPALCSIIQTEGGGGGGGEGAGQVRSLNYHPQ